MMILTSSGIETMKPSKRLAFIGAQISVSSANKSKTCGSVDNLFTLLASVGLQMNRPRDCIDSAISTLRYSGWISVLSSALQYIQTCLIRGPPPWHSEHRQRVAALHNGRAGPQWKFEELHLRIASKLHQQQANERKISSGSQARRGCVNCCRQGDEAQ